MEQHCDQNESQSHHSHITSRGDDVRVGAVVVAYLPDVENVKRILSRLSSQVDEVCIIDNSPDADHSSDFSSLANVHYIPLLSNHGIAYAQNQGIRYFLSKGFEYVLFSDQDSEATENMVDNLLFSNRLLEAQGIKVAAVGTRAINAQSGSPYPPKSKELGIPAEIQNLANAPKITECYSVISSVSLISSDVLKTVGGFDESLFIDGVDHEWCWRAWHNNQRRSFIAEDALIMHRLGEGDRKIGSKSVSIASAERTFFQFRNFIWLSRRDYTPKYWIKKNRIKYLIKAFYFPILVTPRCKYLSNICKGIKEGFSKENQKSWPSFLPTSE